MKWTEVKPWLSRPVPMWAVIGLVMLLICSILCGCTDTDRIFITEEPTVCVCHDGKTLCLPESASRAHLR